ncbi:MAG: bifunctional diaminohydroxyphosphoribosylaminopyrimidine deaminase/5-amino-6-(5-phosphoribosylamino)uracil reductase RibD [Saprospiraceae bacterium]|nr:bifunctional diaminohydroxyphosphoribosylaminopyrimidine deaminase/5-amino-6-(5-phosphoribosylamino)uracil reductase RibD [Saprospiraceae bacterium]
MTDELYMQHCIELAQRGRDLNAPNPKVGALLVYQNRIIGKGWHKRYGEAHAEVNAIRSVAEKDQHLIAQSTIYVTLEPCFHYGKTPPCVDLILEQQIPRVVIGCRDPFGKVDGNSIQKLKEHGVEVKVDVLREQVEWLNRRFFTSCREQRPYIILKYAQTSDGLIGQAQKEVPITNAYIKRLVHKWRGEEAAILVGTNTALVDNPALTTRLYSGSNPVRVVIDKSLRLPNTLQLFDQHTKTIVFSTAKNPPQSTEQLMYIQIEEDKNFLSQLVSKLHKHKIQSLIVEGGAQLLQSFINEGLWDEARVLTASHCLGEGIPAPQLKNATKKSSTRLEDTLLEYYIRTS